MLTYNCIYRIITVIMRLSIDSGSDLPIYQQIELQIKRQIISGELPVGTMLPSIRMLAKELKIGIITAKRAYDDLTEEGFTVSVAGKGVFVSSVDVSGLTAAGEAELKSRFAQCVRLARVSGLKLDDCERILKNVWEGDDECDRRSKP